MSAYVIEDNIPLPKATRSPGGNFSGPKTDWTRTIWSLEVGQSVLTPLHSDFKTAEQAVRRLYPKKYAIRKVSGQGWRVWRME